MSDNFTKIAADYSYVHENYSIFFFGAIFACLLCPWAFPNLNE